MISPSQGKHYSSGTMKAIWNNLRALDLLESLPCVAADAIGCIGHSLGGHNALYTAAFDVRIRAVMSSCGFKCLRRLLRWQIEGLDSASLHAAPSHRSTVAIPNACPSISQKCSRPIAPRPLLVNAPLHDKNFAVEGVRKCETAARAVYLRLNKRDELTVLYPDAEHDFPDDIRQQTYDWFDSKLRSGSTKK